MITDRNTLKSWFVRGAKPLAAQFAAWIDSFVHKDDAVPATQVTVAPGAWSKITGDSVQAALDSADALIGAVGLGSPQGVKTYYGTQQQVEGVGNATEGQTAIAFDPQAQTPAVLAGEYTGSAWNWTPVSPAPDNGMWAAIEYIIAISDRGLVMWIDDGVHPARFDHFNLGIAGAVINLGGISGAATQPTDADAESYSGANQGVLTISEEE
jgi:hypothetical protein